MELGCILLIVIKFCHLPTPSIPKPTTPKCLLQQALLPGSSPPDSQTLRLLNTTFKTKVLNGPLSSPAQQYALDLTGVAERLAAEVTILRTTNDSKSKILDARQERKSGKRLAIKGKFMLTTEEVRDNVLAAEKATAEKRGQKQAPTHPKQPPAKRRKLATPSEVSEESKESSEEESSGAESEISECIALSWS